MKKNNRRGFTLLEMISVLVLIMLLLLLVFPNIINYIKKHDKQVDELNSVIYKEAVNSYISDNQDFFPEDNGNQFCISIKELISSGFLKNIEDEDIVNKTVQIEYNKGYKYKLVDSDKCVVKYPICTPVNEYDKTTGNVPKLDLNTSEVVFTPGDEYRCQVNSRDEYTFFILSTNADETVNLIMDRNIYYDSTTGKSKPADSVSTGLVAWQESELNSDGPVTAMNYLYNATKAWSNVPNINIDYTDSTSENTGGYSAVKTTGTLTKIIKKDGNSTVVLEDKEGYKNLKARIPYKSEVSNYDSINKTNLYLYDYLNQSGTVQTNSISHIYGYWLLSSNNSNTFGAWLIYCDGLLQQFTVHQANHNGIRPVITLSKNYMRKPIK